MADNHVNEAKSALIFVTHVATATLILVVIALAALGLSAFASILEGFDGHWVCPWWLISTLKLLEYFLFGIDVLTFVVYVAVKTVRFLLSLKEAT